jgi:glycosyltransferase involved in cell wall biosynthesis
VSGSGASSGPGAARRARIAIFGGKDYPSRGGTGRVVESTLRQLSGRYDFTVYAYASPGQERHIPGVRVVAFPEPRGGGAGVFLYFARCLAHALRADYELVHVHKTDAAFALPFLTRRFPCVATSHERAYLNSKWSAPGRLYFRLAERAFVRAHAYRTAVSREQAEYYAARHGCEVRFVPNGVESLEFDVTTAERLLSSAGVGAGYLLFAARRVIPLKGAHTLLAALARNGFRGTLLLLGDLAQMPEYTAELRARAQGLDVRFLGYVAERATLLELVRRAAAFVFPSEREGMSMMLLEAAATGTPVLCSDIRANTDVLGADECVRFRSGDEADLAAQLLWMERNPGEARSRAARARDAVEARFGAPAVAEQYARLYEEALAARQAAAGRA